jgi:AraC family transcriptional regulator of adaptative response/methylated-DNA-[protein]-cysteine methyltransferase
MDSETMNSTLRHSAQRAADYGRIEEALGFITERYLQKPALKEIAEKVHLSEYHFDRLFKRWAGTSPQRFLHFLTKEHAKRLLEESRDLLDVAYTSGLSSPGRLHDLFVTYEAVSPGEFKRKGEGLALRFGFHPSPFGECMIAVTDRGICGLEFSGAGERDVVLKRLRSRWPEAEIIEDMNTTRSFSEKIFRRPEMNGPPIHLLLRGTNFQIKVWEALLRIAPGHVASYEGVAQLVGKPHASRAVGTALGQNPIAYLIPCHRVILESGALGNYRWGTAKKKAMLGWEMLRNSKSALHEAS